VNQDAAHVREDATAAFRCAAVATGLNIVGMAFDGVFMRVRFNANLLAHLASTAVSGALLALLLWRWSRPTKRLGMLAFLTNNVVIIAALWIEATLLTAQGVQAMPFQAEKLGALAVALLAPPSLWVGLASIVGFTGVSLLRFELWGPSVQAALPTEPLATIAYGIFGLGLYGYRLHGRKVQREAADARAEAVALKRVSRMLLAVRDVANTPLQTLQLTNVLLERRCPEEHKLIERMSRGIARLEEMNRTISRCESEIVWQREDESFDAAAILEGREDCSGD
jgi:hypothetical protein